MLNVIVQLKKHNIFDTIEPGKAIFALLTLNYQHQESMFSNSQFCEWFLLYLENLLGKFRVNKRCICRQINSNDVAQLFVFSIYSCFSEFLSQIANKEVFFLAVSIS